MLRYDQIIGIYHNLFYTDWIVLIVLLMIWIKREVGAGSKPISLTSNSNGFVCMLVPLYASVSFYTARTATRSAMLFAYLRNTEKSALLGLAIKLFSSHKPEHMYIKNYPQFLVHVPHTQRW